MREVLAEQEFRLLIVARLVSQLGNQAAVAVMAFAVLGIGGDAADIGLVLGAESFALALALVVGGVVGDRVSRRLVMVGADLVRCGSQGGCAALLITGQAQVWHLVVLQVISGIAAGVYLPAVTAIGAEASTPENRKDANAVRSLVIAVSTIAGPAIGGLLTVWVGPGPALAVDALSFLVSASLVLALRIGHAPAPTGRRVLAQARDGWREFTARRWLWSVTVLAAFCGMAVFAPVMVLGPVILGNPAAWVTVLTALGIGALVGGVALTRVRPRRYLRWVVSGALLLLPLPVLLALHAPLPALVVGAFVLGVEQSAHWTLWQTTLQHRVPSDMLARVSSYDWLGYYGFGPLGYLLAPAAAIRVGNTPTLIAGAAIVFTLAVTLLMTKEISR
ncbi:MFS transporter [Actinokineospora globicatena]|uniref:MFS transporter n=1 Tax=Actinokineospora globicatena TaxID=103729 RepID=UPI0020A61289|nr:MFS transporter [Actinokineospora globicatena]MCP2302972.1 putative arabinose efflux permease, MFS family [Actinokineospora globicatena]GLW79923.1 MFS transporter [Actinokineospora globicatena]GLW85668.1 MFS transporter [Actinokineospora globicatena]